MRLHPLGKAFAGHLAPAAGAVFALTFAMGLAGCEEHVVGVRNPANDHSWQFERQPTASERQGGIGPVESVGRSVDGVGDFLFGWMKKDDTVRYTPGESKDMEIGTRYGPTIRSQ